MAALEAYLAVGAGALVRIVLRHSGGETRNHRIVLRKCSAGVVFIFGGVMEALPLKTSALLKE